MDMWRSEQTSVRRSMLLVLEYFLLQMRFPQELLLTTYKVVCGQQKFLGEAYLQ